MALAAKKANIDRFDFDNLPFQLRQMPTTKSHSLLPSRNSTTPHHAMPGQLFDVPIYWISKGSCITARLFKELKRRVQIANIDETLEALTDNLVYIPPLSGESWAQELLYVRILLYEYPFDDDVLELLARILCQGLKIPRNCSRNLLDYQQHNLIFFTNHRALQVYCCHDSSEKRIVDTLIKTDLQFRLQQEDGKLDGETYHQCTDILFWKARPYLAWESFFPEGIDMEALSPRDVNAHLRKQTAPPKPKVQPAKPTQKEKDHPPPPPSEVHEPPSTDRKDGAIYRTGRCLGKGGFAICYEGRLAGTRQLYALKIVKSHMPQKKMEQKFQTELQIHSKMNHSNIVRFQRAFSYNQCTYIVLELCPNGSLMDMIKKRKFVTEPEVRFWTVQMAGAIKYMHAKGIIHRDLKMGNIFLDKDMNVKVGDFGLAALLIFAMLTGKPPFQSTTADEIYRRAREREYDWPKLNTSENFISPETKDLVSEMLQAPEDRPDPDTIVQHPFFTCGWIPQSEEMTPDLREKAPTSDQFLSVGVRAGRSNLYVRNLKKLCIKCEVGPWNPSEKAPTSTYREVAAEEKAGLTPAVPLPEGIVYRPFNEVEKELKDQIKVEEDDEDEDMEVAEKVPDSVPASKQQPPLPKARPAPQSFAAQQRARPGLPNASTRVGTGRQHAKELSRSAATSSSRPMINTSGRQPRTRAIESQAPEKVVDVEDRLAADLAKQLSNADAERKSQEAETLTLSLEKPQSLFNPRERLELLPNTKPDHILASLRRFQTEIERALNSRSMVAETNSKPSPPTIVVKWVDYTNKHGLSYILSNGSVGCIFKAEPVDPADGSKGHLPPSCVIVRDAERHLQNRKNEAYMDRHQLVPVSGPNIEFYESQGVAGISRGKVNPQNYKVAFENGELRRASRAVDEWDDRKWKKIVVWKKFANYMVAFGRDHNYPHDDALKRNSEDKKAESVAAGNAVTFYQRWGDVGCWGFCDGHFQFNFPDHTKIVISADGTWCDFYHLPLEAARDLATKGTISPSALDDQIDPMIQGVPEANDFRKKIEFIRLVVKEWTSNGGLGNSNMDPKRRLKWTGHRELINVQAPYKHVWVTVGARNGDERRVAWFDPKDPDKIIPDIEG
ncbi:hypothetical protein G7Y89_g9997 [Cudoniella acicularis]|uniref:Serine/threonine-protein kinase ATG1 n=1 Tax=Cudoniella acicularis TaxID=354080 RepID=A0A8H4RDL4_9HELO|nr:hypothetical protein G7Y89_g9997 [Cudoniella acicularis]